MRDLKCNYCGQKGHKVAQCLKMEEMAAKQNPRGDNWVEAHREGAPRVQGAAVDRAMLGSGDTPKHEGRA